MPFPATQSLSYSIASGFTGKDGQTPTQPYIIPPEYGSAGLSQPNLVMVQVVGAAGPSFSSTKAVLPANNDFALAWSGNTAQLSAGATSMANTSVWSVGTAPRQALKANFDAMFQGLETLEYAGQLAAGASILLAQRMAESLPLSLAETLLYRCNFSPTDMTGPLPARRYVDLLPGMRLRVESAAGLFTAPGSSFNGFVGSGASYWGIVRRRTDQALLFDAFAGVVGSYTPPVAGSGVWGLMDLQSAANARYYRLFFPQSQFAAWPGYANANESCTLVGAQYLADLATATQAYTSGQTIPPSGQGTIATTYFRGRTVVVPEQQIRVNSNPAWVPVGITARQYAESLMIPSFTAQNVALGLQPIRCLRVWSGADIAAGLAVQILGMVDGAFPNGIDAWDLPLARGDCVNFNYTS